MPDENKVIELTRLWWKGAGEDLQVAKASRHIPFACCFHCQQAAEKAIKALLVLHQADFGKTHAIDDLLDLLRATSTPPPESKTEGLHTLTRFAVETRYPPSAATPQEAADALDQAEKFLLWARTALPDSV